MSNKTTITAEPDTQEIFITREFDVSRDLLYNAFTEAKLLLEWLAPFRKILEQRFDELDKLLIKMKSKPDTNEK